MRLALLAGVHLALAVMSPATARAQPKIPPAVPPVGLSSTSAVLPPARQWVDPSDPLTPAQVLVLVNLEQAGADELAQRYLKARGIPADNVITFRLPVATEVDRATYEREIAPAVRQRVAAGGRLRAVVSLFGMPLRVAAPVPTAQWPKLRAGAERSLRQAAAELEADVLYLTALAKEGAAAAGARPVAQVDAKLPVEKAREVLPRLDEAFRAVAGRVAKEPDPQARGVLQQALLQTLERTQGSRRVAAELRATSTDPAAVAQLDAYRRRASEQGALADHLAADPVDAPSRADLYACLAASRGAVGVMAQALADRATLSGPPAEQVASLEGELAVVLWPRDNPLGQWVRNPLRWGTPPADDRVTLMAVRLDGPDLATVQRMIDDSLATEAAGLDGTVYLDARGIRQRDGYFEYDQDLRALAKWLKAKSTLPVVLDDRDALFAPGSCPDAAVYCGWYSLENYVDAFAWKGGAVAYHLASFEAVEVRAPSNRWVHQLLRRGVAATIGPVAEPYLQSFPKPSQLLPLVLSGQLTFAECHYATAPTLSWMQSPFGDPLYRPFARKPAVRMDDARDAATETSRR